MSQGPRKRAAEKPATEWSADELIPFGKYVLLERLSSGATAAVFRAKTDGDTFERVVALKRILPQMAGDQGFLEAFVREARLAAKLSHANICPIYELGRVGESLYMTMENIEGKDLGRVVERLREARQPMPAEAAAWITARLCDALDYAHGLRDGRGKAIGIVHRDLSPGNVVLSYDGHIKLVDFGVATAVGEAQQTNLDALSKKLGYMSPEMVKGRPVDARSDIFSVGVLLYELVTDRRLFAGGDDLQTLGLVGRASVPPPSAITEEAPEALELIVMKALAREPGQRYQTAGEMAAALTGFLVQEAPLYGPRELAAFLTGLFGEDIAAEGQRTRLLIEASRDPEVMGARRAYFSSTEGAVAAAQAQARSRPPKESASGHLNAPAAEPLWPAEADTTTETFSLLPSPGADLDVEPTMTPTKASRNPTQQGRASAGTRRPPAQPPVHQQPVLRASSPPHHGRGPGTRPPAAPIPGGASRPPPMTNRPPARSAPPPTASAVPRRLSTPPPPARSSVPPWAQMPTPAPMPRHAPPVAAGHSAPVPAQHAPAFPAPVPAPARLEPPPPYEPPIDFPEEQAQPGGRIWALMLAAGLALLVGALGFALHRRFTASQPSLAPEASAPGYGTVEVRTTPPAAATVTLDGITHGQAPLRLTQVAAGSHELRVTAPGFAPDARTIEVPEDATAALNIELQPASSPQE